MVQQPVKKVIIYGDNNPILHFKLNYIKVIGYLDSTKFSENSYSFILEKDLYKYEYDYIIILDSNSKLIIEKLIQNGINSEKIVDFFHCINQYVKTYYNLYNNNVSYSCLYSRIGKIKESKDFEVIVSGCSYSLYGIIEDQVRYKCIKFTLPSQDLYYDYSIIKEVLKVKKRIKYCIIGIAYYSFDFDLKFSSDSPRILTVYYPIFKDSHHLKLPENYLANQGKENINNLVNTDIDKFFSKEVYNYAIKNLLKLNLTPDFAESYWYDEGFYKTLNEEERKLGARKRVDSHNKFNHPDTYREYKDILEEYLKLLNHYNIKPIMVVFPTTKYYYENFDLNIKDRFYYTINELKNNYDFQLIDMFKSEKFDLTDFMDWDHLNKKGATKMTQYLNDLIEW